MSAFDKLKSMVSKQTSPTDTSDSAKATDDGRLEPASISEEISGKLIDDARVNAALAVDATQAVSTEADEVLPEPSVSDTSEIDRLIADFAPTDTKDLTDHAAFAPLPAPAAQLETKVETADNYSAETFEAKADLEPRPTAPALPVDPIPAPRYEASLDTTSSMTPAPRQLQRARKTDNLAHIRTDLAQLNDDMSSGEQFYAQSLKRINNLITYAYETEANLSALEHLEPENRRLTEELDAARQKANDQTVRAESFKSKADAYESNYLDARQSLEKAQLALTKLEMEQERIGRELAEKDVEIAGLNNSNRTIRNELAVDRQTQEKLSAKNLSLSSELSVTLSHKLELEKRNAEYISKIEQLTSDVQELERVVVQTRGHHKASEEHNIALKTEMERVLSDVQIFKQQFDTTSRTQTAQINTLRANTADLETEIQIKTDIVAHAHDEMADLRAKYDSAHRGRRKLLDHIEEEKLKADGLHDAHTAAKSEAQGYSSQILSLQAEVDELRRLNALQSSKLKKYMTLNTTPVTTQPRYPQRASLSEPIISAAERASAVASLASQSVRRSPIEVATQKLPPLRQTLTQTLTAVKEVEPVKQTRTPPPLREVPHSHKQPSTDSAPRYTQSESISAVSAAPVAVTSQETYAPATAPESSRPKSDQELEFDRKFEALEGYASPQSTQSVAHAKTEAESIDETLKRFHEIDLLGESENIDLSDIAS